MKTNAGIDYGMGQTNRAIVHTSRGNEIIHYGVIPQGEVLQAWADSSDAIYPPGEENDENSNYLETEPIAFVIDNNEYRAEQNADDTDIFILRSPYYTYAPYCSPCAPGAGYLMDATERTKDNGVKTFCFGHDFFENGRAPYIVYRVSDNSIVE